MDQAFANENVNKLGMLLLLDIPSEMHFGSFFHKTLIISEIN